jgi:hypothetical protein
MYPEITEEQISHVARSLRAGLTRVKAA